MMEIKGYLFDVYNFESDIHLWIKDELGNLHLFRDTFHPVIYAHAAPDDLRKLVHRLTDLNAIAEPPRFVTMKHFYRNEAVHVLRLAISRPSVLTKIRQKLYALRNKIDIYHTDVEIPNAYMHERGIYPFAPVIARIKKPPLWNRLDAIIALEPESVLDYNLPDLRIMQLGLEKSHRLPVGLNNRIEFRFGTDVLAVSGANISTDLQRINEFVLSHDPDVILSAYGDQKIMPTLFTWSGMQKIPLALDRDQVPGLQRNIVRKGFSVNTYGSWIFRAASYPLYGRLHIDSGNSFVFSNSDFAGVIELARLSRTPIQRVARTSTGAALTNMEVHNAMDRKYLVPWQKSKVEDWRTVSAMIEGDKGGLIFQPNIRQGCVYENVAQLDYSQMYPSIMVNHNISPETVNCECCANDPNVPKTPESKWRICVRREGVVAQTLRHVLARRKHYKIQLKRGENAETEAKQSALKWLLVISFGYLGYRNAKFGRLESHESVTSFGREILLRAKELSEEAGFEFIHAITDSIFIRNSDGSPIEMARLGELCDRIFVETHIEMAIEGVYRWAIFLPSKTDERESVANRYAGLFDNGKLKVRGLTVRRKDMPVFVKNFQSDLLAIMQTASDTDTLRAAHAACAQLFETFKQNLINRTVPWSELLLRRTASRSPGEYVVSTGTALALQQMQQRSIEVQAGEKVRYLVLNRRSKNAENRYESEEIIFSRGPLYNPHYDIDYYFQLLLQAFEEIWQFFAPEGYFRHLAQLGAARGLF